MIDRIKLLMDYSRMATSVFADTIGISRSGLTHLLNGRNQPSLDVIKKILYAFPDVSTEWLMFGLGDMLKGKPSATESPIPKNNSVNNNDCMQQIELFSDYPSEIENHAQESEMTPKSNFQRDIVQPTVKPNKTATDNPSLSSKKKTRNSQSKGVVKIVFFYNDNSFEEYIPTI